MRRRRNGSMRGSRRLRRRAPRIPGADRLAATHALKRHLALVGFMGAGKSTLGPEVAERLDRRFVDLDRELEHILGQSIPELFQRSGGEVEFRVREAEQAITALRLHDPAVIAFGGGAVETTSIRNELRERAFTVLLEVDPGTAWERSAGGDRPLAQDETEFHALYERRRELYDDVADARAHDVDDVVLAAGGVHVRAGSLKLLQSLVPGDWPVALVTDPHVAGIYGATVQVALGTRLASVHEVPQGEEAKTAAVAERLWNELRLDRRGTVVGLGGGCTTDLAGFVAATYMRGLDWVVVPTSLVGQVDAAIAGEPFWELPTAELVRRCAAFKTAVCLRDPYDRGERAILNLGHTFAHALEAAADYRGLTHGSAVALGLLAALRLSGRPTDVVEQLLQPRPVRIDRDRAWAALGWDKKTGLVLLDDEGPRWNVEVPANEVRRALDELIL